MNVNLVCAMLVLDTIPNPDIRKNDIKTVKLLLRRGESQLPAVGASQSDDIKQQMRNAIGDIIGIRDFHLEQVYALGDKKYLSIDGLDIIHLAVINKDRLNIIAPEYELVNIAIQNGVIKIGDMEYEYKTIEKVGESSIEYLFKTTARDARCDKMLIEILTAWKYLINRLDSTDIMFKLLSAEFTLEDVRQVYELISGHNVDKSNFHKKIIKYCTEIPNKTLRRGYRPSKIYKFNVKPGDLWL